MAEQITSGEYAQTFKIPFQDHKYRLSTEWLKKYAHKETRSRGDWRRPDLKFHSYHKGTLTLLNNYENRSYKLMLKVEGHDLLVTCSCGSRHSHLCEHAYGGLTSIIIVQGAQYFKKLRPGDEFDLAFAHSAYFDKKESTAGINVYPRPELESVFMISSGVNHLEIPGILSLPGEEESIPASGHVVTYLVLLPYEKVMLPGILPCVAQLNKERTSIKTWIHFLHKVPGQYGQLIDGRNKVLINNCNKLWELITRGSDRANRLTPDSGMDSIVKSFDKWKRIFPLLKKQPFVYTYKFYGIAETKRRPYKQKAVKVTISDSFPSLKFVLMDKGPFYEFHMQVWLEGKHLKEADYNTVFVILHEGVLYRLPTLRDAVLAHWMGYSGGWVTVFKEQFELFKEAVIVPLREKYSVTAILRKKDKSQPR